MNREDLFEAIGTADEAMLERSEKKVNRKRNWLISATAAVACFALLFGIVWQYIRPIMYGSDHNIVKQNVFWIGEPDYGVPDDADGGVSGGLVSAEFGPSYQFGRAKSVHVKIKEILPDTYCYPGSNIAYHILRLKVLDTIVGENMPSEIYFLLPGYLSTDLKAYDSFIMTVEQAGFEDYLMINATKERAETFTLLFQSPDFIGGVQPVPTQMGAMIAFTDDKLDTSLWDKPGWDLSKNWVEHWITDERETSYPGKIGRTVSDTKKAIREVYDDLKEYYFQSNLEIITTDYFDWAEAREALAYVRSLGIGTFSQDYRGVHSESPWKKKHSDQLEYTRYINGFGTNEEIVIYSSYTEFMDGQESENKYVQYSEARFTEQDLKNLPDLAGFINNASTKEPPGGDKALRFYYASGRYEKYGDEVFGVASLYWGYPAGNGSYKHKTITYHLLCPDGTVHEATTRREIDNLIAQYQS